MVGNLTLFTQSPVIALTHIVTLVAFLAAFTWLLLAYPLYLYKKASLRFSLANCCIIGATQIHSFTEESPLYIAITITLSFFAIWFYYSALCYFFYASVPAALARVSRIVVLINAFAFLTLAYLPGLFVAITCLCALATLICAGQLKYFGLANKFNLTAARVLILPDVLIATTIYSGLFLVMFIPDKVTELFASLPASTITGWALIALILLLNISAMAMTITRIIFRMRFLAERDQLTGLLNRRAIHQRLHNLWLMNTKHGGDFSVLMIDIDHFKSINDQFGHARGDAVIVAVSGLLKSSLRETDYVARFGGEEFLVVLSAADTRITHQVAQKLCQSIEDAEFSDLPPVTVSIGFALASQATSLDTLINFADDALYRAKDNGRNQVSAYVSQTASYSSSASL